MRTRTSDHYRLSANQFSLPGATNEGPGIAFGEQRVRSMLLSTNLDYIHNLDTDAVLVIHPFQPSKRVNRAVLHFCEKPTICGIGGGSRNLERTIELARDAECSGAAGVVITRPTNPAVVEQVRNHTAGKLIYTLIYEEDNIPDLVAAGVDMFNVSTGKGTPNTIRTIRKYFPGIPVAANGGPFDSTINETIRSGADAIVYNPPTATEMMRSIFENFKRSKI